jgi:hypothetical protein
MENIFGGLIEFKSKNEFDSFIENISKEDALQIVEASISYGQQNGLYTLEESHSLYKCLTKLKQND